MVSYPMRPKRGGYKECELGTKNIMICKGEKHKLLGREAILTKAWSICGAVE
jgi:hypothetical protein